MTLEEVSWPLFTYCDPLQQLNYYLIERPMGSGTLAPHWGAGHKMLLLQGQNAKEVAEHIYREFNSIPTGEDSERTEILNSLLQSFMPVSIYEQHPSTPPSKKSAKERAELEDLFALVLDYLDLNEQ